MECVWPTDKKCFLRINFFTLKLRSFFIADVDVDDEMAFGEDNDFGDVRGGLEPESGEIDARTFEGIGSRSRNVDDDVKTFRWRRQWTS